MLHLTEIASTFVFFLEKGKKTGYVNLKITLNWIL